MDGYSGHRQVAEPSGSTAGRPPRDTGRRAAPLRPEAVADAPRWALPLGRARRSRVQADQALEARRGECSFRVISTLVVVWQRSAERDSRVSREERLAEKEL